MRTKLAPKRRIGDCHVTILLILRPIKELVDNVDGGIGVDRSGVGSLLVVEDALPSYRIEMTEQATY